MEKRSDWVKEIAIYRDNGGWSCDVTDMPAHNNVSGKYHLHADDLETVLQMLLDLVQTPLISVLHLLSP
jgi:hypothetical protein